MAHLQAPRRHEAPQTPSASHGDPRWRNDASFTMLVAALVLMVLTLALWVG